MCCFVDAAPSRYSGGGVVVDDGVGGGGRLVTVFGSRCPDRITAS